MRRFVCLKRVTKSTPLPCRTSQLTRFGMGCAQTRATLTCCTGWDFHNQIDQRLVRRYSPEPVTVEAKTGAKGREK